MFGPVGADGYPMRIWNKETGAIDHAVAEQWRKYDLLDVINSHPVLKNSGAYYGPRGPFEMRGHPTVVRPTAAARRPADSQRLWELSERETGVTYTWH